MIFNKLKQFFGRGFRSEESELPKFREVGPVLTGPEKPKEFESVLPKTKEIAKEPTPTPFERVTSLIGLLPKPPIDTLYQERERNVKSWMVEFQNHLRIPVEKATTWLTEREEREHRPPFTVAYKTLNVSRVENFALSMFGRIAEAPVRAVVVGVTDTAALAQSIQDAITTDMDLYEALISEKNSQADWGFDARRLGFSQKEVRTVAAETQDMLDAGFGPLETGLMMFGTRTLDVAVGARILTAGARTTTQGLVGTGTSIKKVEAWKQLGAPSTQKQLLDNYRRMAHQFHPDKPGGSHELMSLLTNAKNTILKDGKLSLPTHGDFFKYQTWRATEPFTRETFIANILKGGPPIIKGPDGTLKMNVRTWKEIWQDARTFPNRFAKPDLIRTGLSPYELQNAETVLKLPGYRPVPGQPPPIGLSIQNWERVGGTRGEIAKNLTSKYGPERANEIIRYRGEELLNDVAAFGIKQATSDIMLADVPNVVKPKVSEAYNTLREAIKSEQVTPIFPHTDKGIHELSPSLYKLADDSVLMKTITKLRELGKEYQRQIITGKREPGLLKEIQDLTAKKLKEAEKLGIAIIKDSEGKDVPAIRQSGFFGSSELMKHEIKDAYSAFASPLNIANEQDATFQLQEGMFGPITRINYFPFKEAETTKNKAVIEVSQKILEAARANKVKVDKKSGEQIFDIWHKVKTDDLVKMTPAQIKSNYPAVKEYPDGVIEIVSLMSKEMSSARITNNTLREMMGRELIGKIDYYGPHMVKTDIWNKIQNDPQFRADPTYDYIVPNTTRNPFAKHRFDKIAPEDLEKNAWVLYEKYMNAMYNDTYMTPVIEQLKANNMVLRHLGKNKAIKYWDLIIKQNITRRPGTVDAYFGVTEGTIAKWGLEKVIDARIKASLAGNILWSITTQPLSYLQLTVKDTGLVNSFAKGPLNWIFNKELKKEIAKDHTMVLKEKKAHSAAYQGGLDSYDQSIYKTPMRKAADVLTILVHTVERNLTGMSYAAGKEAGRHYGYTGDDLLHFASRMAEHTQSLYNRALRPPILNETIVRAGFPFQTWGLEFWRHNKQIFGKGKMPASARVRFGMGVNFIVGTLIGNAYIRAIRGYTYSTPGDFFPFIGGGVDYALDQFLGTDFSYKKRDSIALVEDAAELGRAMSEISQMVQELSSNNYEDISELAKAAAEYAADPGNFEKLRKQLIYWGSGLSGMGGGVQANRVVDMIIDAERGYVEDAFGREWFPVELRDIPIGMILGKYRTPSAKEAIKETEEQDALLESIQATDKDERQKEAVRLHEKFKTIDPDEASQEFNELRLYDPLLAQRIAALKEAEEKDLTKIEAGWLRFNIEGGYRAKALYERYKEKPEEERWKVFNEFIRKGIITPKVQEQLEQWYGWAPGGDEKPTKPEPKELRDWQPPVGI